jgi:hypothetical protein
MNNWWLELQDINISGVPLEWAGWVKLYEWELSKINKRRDYENRLSISEVRIKWYDLQRTVADELPEDKKSAVEDPFAYALQYQNNYQLA